MGGLFGGKKKPATPAGTPQVPNDTIGGYKAGDPTVAGRSLSSGGFPDDSARRMPSLNDPVAAENERQRVFNLRSRSGRTSTDLSGTHSYVNSLMGHTG